jgi:DNA polymerase III delta prime subunit
MASEKKAVICNSDWRHLTGFEETFTALQSIREQNLFPQVCLFEGRGGIGKARFSAQVAALFFCEHNSSCGKCGGCLSVIKHQQSDLLWVETTESTIKLADAHAICEHMLTSSAQGAARVCVIIDADKLNTQASNRLLKTSEELPDNAFMILTTSHYKHMLATLRSRSFRWKLRKTNQASASSNEMSIVDPELLTDLSAVFSKQGVVEDALILIESLVKKHSLNAATLAKALEVALNITYKKIIAEPRASDVDSWTEKREYLRQIKRRALKEKVALNTQLSFEGWVLH